MMLENSLVTVFCVIFRLEGEKASLEKIFQSDLVKRKKTPDDNHISEGSSDELKSKKSSEQAPVQSTKSPMEALDELIIALGQLPPSTEEVIAKLKSQVNFLIQVSYKVYKSLHLHFQSLPSRQCSVRISR